MYLVNSPANSFPGINLTASKEREREQDLRPEPKTPAEFIRIMNVYVHTRQSSQQNENWPTQTERRPLTARK